MSTLAAAALAVLLAPVGLYALLLGSVCIAYARRALYFLRFGPKAPVGLWRFLRILPAEAAATFRVLCWWVVRRGEDLGRPKGHGRAVVLIHGLSADGTSMFAIRRALVALGRRTVSPHLGHIYRPIERYGERLVRELKDVEGDLEVVAHSLGGVILRAALVIEPALAARIKRVVCVASPHQGTGAARYLPLPEARQVVPGSAWLTALPSLAALLPHARLTTIATDTDAVVYPHQTSHIEGADTHDLSGLGHAETLLDPRIVMITVDALAGDGGDGR